MAAAGVVCAGIEVDPPKTSILSISFKHPDRDIVQPVLKALLEAYMLKHRDVRLMPDDYLLQQRDELRTKLAQTEEEQKRLKMRAKMPFPEEAGRSFQRQIAKVQDDLLDAQRELLERKAMLGDKALSQTNSAEAFVPADKLTSYSFATTRLEELKRQVSDLLLQYTGAHPLVLNVQDRIEKLTRQKADLEQQYPGLASLLVSGARLGTNTVGTEVLAARAAALSTVLSNVQAQAAQVMDLEPQIADLQRLRAEQQKAYESVIARIEQQQRDESLVSGRVMNMSQVQSPTPPGLDYKK